MVGGSFRRSCRSTSHVKTRPVRTRTGVALENVLHSSKNKKCKRAVGFYQPYSVLIPSPPSLKSGQCFLFKQLRLRHTSAAFFDGAIHSPDSREPLRKGMPPRSPKPELRLDSGNLTAAGCESSSCRRPPDAVIVELVDRRSPGLKKWGPCQGGGWLQISDPAALPETSSYASGRVVFTLPEAARCDQSLCRRLPDVRATPRRRLPDANKILAGGNASCAPQGKGNELWGDEHRINFPQFWVKEVGQMGTLARHNTQNGQKRCDYHSPFKSMVHKRNNFPCSVIIARIVRRKAHRRCRRMSFPRVSPELKVFVGPFAVRGHCIAP